MAVELRLADAPNVAPRYIGWAPVRCLLSDRQATAATQVTLEQRTTAQGGRLQFAGPTGAFSPSLRVQLQAGGRTREVRIAGVFRSPSRADGDVEIVVRGAGGAQLAAFPAMIRVRKNADTLDSGERDRFLRAIATLNSNGVFQSFRDCHRLATSAEAHGNAGFLPWHRAYLLDLERELQRVDASVTLPYWRFDQVARRLFRADFIGAADAQTGLARFTPTNPLDNWAVDGVSDIDRLPRFNTQQTGAAVLAEASITTHTGAYRSLPRPFETDPHGFAHTSFVGSISSIDTAARDPLFYMLHCNADRLWAKWQWAQKRRNPGSATSFDGQQPEGQRRAGHNLADTMWPWNNVKTGTRPRVAPRQPFPQAPAVPAPGRTPRLRDMIDYQGVHAAGARLGFDYDDVPYQP